MKMQTNKRKEIKIGLFGSSGKMGQAVEQVILSGLQNAPTHSFSIHPYIAVGKKMSSLFSVSAVDINSTEDQILEDVDVWIDFSSPAGLSELIRRTRGFRTSIVSGTTGLSSTDFKNLKKEATSRPIFWASNMSPGLWAFRQAMKSLSLVQDFDFAIEEVHHNKKKDRPSGTAITLREDLEAITHKKIETPSSLRLGGVFGIHQVWAASSHEVITLQHQALSRSVFAEGAVKASLWLSQKTKGYFSMEDLFKTK